MNINLITVILVFVFKGVSDLETFSMDYFALPRSCATEKNIHWPLSFDGEAVLAGKQKNSNFQNFFLEVHYTL